MSTASLRRCLAEFNESQPALCDSELMSRFRAERDSDAFAMLIHRHGPVVLATCQRLLSNSADAEDAFQIVFMNLVRSSHAIRRTEALPAWLHRSAIRTSIRIRTQRLAATPLPVETVDPADPFVDVAWRDLRSALDEELDRLPGSYRIPLILCLLDGCTRDEAAERLGCSLNTIKRRLEKGRSMLRQRLLRRGIAPIVLAIGVLEENRLKAAVPYGLTAKVVTMLTETKRIGFQLPGCGKSWLRASLLATVGAITVAAIGIGSFFPPQSDKKAGIETGRDRVESSEGSAKTGDNVDLLPHGVTAQFGTLHYRVPDQIKTFTISPDGKFAAVESPRFLTYRTVIRVYEIATWRLLYQYPLTLSRVTVQNRRNSLTFSPDCRFLAHIPGDEFAYIWDLRTGGQLHRIENSKTKSPVANSWLFCQFTSEGQLALSDADKLCILDPINGHEVRSVPLGNITHLTPDGHWYIRCPNGPQENPVFGDAFTGKDYPSSKESVIWSVFHSRAFTPDSKSLLLVRGFSNKDADFEINGEIWTLAPFRMNFRFSHIFVENSKYSGWRIDADGKTVSVFSKTGGIIRWDVKTQKELPRLTRSVGECATNGLQVLPDGKKLVWANTCGLVQLFDAESGKEVPVPNRYGAWFGSAISQDGKLLFGRRFEMEWVCLSPAQMGPRTAGY